MSEIAPNSPEAQAKARKVRNLFFAIALVNVLLVAIVLWARARQEGKLERPDEPAVEVQR